MKIIFSFVLAASLVACGASDTCSRGSKCSADPKRTDAEIKTCQDATKDGTKCLTELKALADCSYTAQVCGSDNKTDGTATASKVASDCKTQSDAYTTCASK